MFVIIQFLFFHLDSFRSCFVNFWERLKSSKYFQQKHGVMVVKTKTIHNLVWQNWYRLIGDINKFPKICLRKYFRLIGPTHL